jgi:hypothetical protein
MKSNDSKKSQTPTRISIESYREILKKMLEKEQQEAESK